MNHDPDEGGQPPRLGYERVPRKYPKAPDPGRWAWLVLLVLAVLAVSCCLNCEIMPAQN